MNNIHSIKLLKDMRSSVGSWGDIDRKRLQSVLKLGGNKILDIGCATGSYVQALDAKGFDAYGCDILSSPSWNGKLKKRFKVADVYDLPYSDNSFDTVLLFETLEHISKPEVALKEISRIMGNNLILSVPNCEQPQEFKASGLSFHHWVDRTHVNFFNKKTIQDLLKKNGFKIRTVKFIDPIMPETLLLKSWHLPLKISELVGKLCQLIPFRKKYFLAILIVAKKNHEN